MLLVLMGLVQMVFVLVLLVRMGLEKKHFSSDFLSNINRVLNDTMSRNLP